MRRFRSENPFFATNTQLALIEMLSRTIHSRQFLRHNGHWPKAPSRAAIRRLSECEIAPSDSIFWHKPLRHFMGHSAHVH